MASNWKQRAAYLTQHGLYDPATEHDACGVGLVAAIDGKPRREIVEKGIEALKAIYHRGAVDADGKTGDGAGINVQIPQAFFADYLQRIGRRPEGILAVGQLFLPKRNFSAQEACRGIIEREVGRAGMRILGWRQVPVVAGVVGEIANESRPEVEQILLSPPKGMDEAAFELALYFTRKRIEKAVQVRAIDGFYICSLSCRSLIYKGLFKAEQLTAFYPDLLDERFISAYALFHQRFSTNTAPAWHLAQPFRIIAHNGEINTLKGNVNFMRSHEATFHCAAFEGHLEDVMPVIPDNISDTGALDSVVELLTRAGRPLPLAKLILVPPAWSLDEEMKQAHKDLFSFCNTISEPWDGPAAIVATDGEWVIAGMDRSGLRPLRTTITEDGLLIAASEAGMVPVECAVERGRLGPGEMIGINLREGKLYKDEALKDRLAAEQPYGEWVKGVVRLENIVRQKAEGLRPEEEKQAFALGLGLSAQAALIAAFHTHEEIETILHPMAAEGKEAIGSMGDDTPLSVLSDEARPFHHFFRQSFSQVTNPPIDPLRERRVMSLYTRFGNNGNYLALDGTHSQTLLCPSPILLGHELAAVQEHFFGKLAVLQTMFAVDKKHALREALDALVARAEQALEAGQPYLLLTDEAVDSAHAPIPMILAVSAVHSHLVRRKLRKQASLLVKTAECFDVHCAAVLIGCGATVVNPYLAEAVIVQRWEQGLFKVPMEIALTNYREALNGGLLKIMSKMGISVISSYRGGLNFESIGLSRALANEFFPRLPSRISGIGLEGIEARARRVHELAFAGANVLPIGGFYRQRSGTERYAWAGEQVHLLQTACTRGDYGLFKKYSEAVGALPPTHLRDLLDFAPRREALPLESVESAESICHRFIAPAMSLGSLSPEAHEILAIAMNRMGAASNSGEGGEGPERWLPKVNGDNANSSIKQVASGRFGVTAEYLNAASELQIKVAQGAKPGEGGQLPAFKVTTEIARLRYATEGVSLISPPPHHDIYSIEDLAQLIYDLKQINPTAIVSVKLVAQSGIGTIAAGVAKAMADKIVIAGHSGGTGASPWSSVKHAGIPWEMGLAEANQVLTLNRLRHRVTLQTDGGLKTGRDIVIAALLGAEEYALGTAALVAMGCILVRQCHSNTCPVGVATQDPALRAKFEGTVEKVINLFTFVAEEVREILASLGFTKLQEIIGRADLLTQVSRGGDKWMDLDLNNLLALADPGAHPRHFALDARNPVPDTLDAQIIADAGAALGVEPVTLAYEVQNTMRSIGARVSSALVKTPSPCKGEGWGGGRPPPNSQNTFRDIIPGLISHARALRKEPTDAEKKLWHILNRDQMGCRFRRQHPINGYITDFTCTEHKLVVELDGGQQAYDDERKRALEREGYSVLRFWNYDVLQNIDGVYKLISEALGGRPTPTPALSFAGGGSLVTLQLTGSAGQSLAAFGAKGLRIELIGEANDYVGKGLSGAVITVQPRAGEEALNNTIIGNTVLYGATSGALFAAGQAGERFCVRNSGATAVVEGCGSNGCEYMTGGTVVILGEIGPNFAAGMTGGMAFVYDAADHLPARLNHETVIAQRLVSAYWENLLKQLVLEHRRETGSVRAALLLEHWDAERARFWQICPKEMLTRLTHPLNDKMEKRYA